MTTETAAPTAQPAPASAETIAINQAIDAAPGENAETEPKAEEPAKPTKTPEERRIAQLQRAVDRRTKRLGALEAELAEYRANRPLRPTQQGGDNGDADDSEPVSLTRAELEQLVNERARKLAPTLSEQAAEVKRRAGVVESLAKTWGKERFDELSSSLDEAFEGLADRSGRPKPATEAVFEADDPQAVIEYLADPENLDEAERIASLNAVQAGKAIAKLEAQLKAAKQSDKPKVSNAPAPLEPVKGAAPAKKALADLEGSAFDARRREQIANRR